MVNKVSSHLVKIVGGSWYAYEKTGLIYNAYRYGPGWKVRVHSAGSRAMTLKFADSEVEIVGPTPELEMEHVKGRLHLVEQWLVGTDEEIEKLEIHKRELIQERDRWLAKIEKLESEKES